jgi:hypothetical protein
MDKRDPGLDDFHEELAQRFGAISRLFADLGTPGGAKDLLDRMMSEDPRALDPILDGVDLPIPMLGKCMWVREVLERVIHGPMHFETVCWVKDNLTPAEQLTYLQIWLRYRPWPPQVATGTSTLVAGHVVIPPGPFLDELKANGLTECDTVATQDSTLVPVLGRPERICV